MRNLCRLLLAAGIATVGLVNAQSPLTFEVASIKPANPDSRGSGFNFVPGGGLKVTNMPLKALISFAYDVRDFQISGGPGWITTARYDILAKPEGPPGPGDLSQVTDQERDLVLVQVRERLRTLLADRFQLDVHKETKELPVYGLVVAKNGLRMEESKEVHGGSEGMSQNGNNGKYVLTAKRTPIERLTRMLSNALGRPVLDQTGLKAYYDFKIEWTQDLSAKGPDTLGEAALSDSAGPSLFTAIQQQLGLKLESQKGPVEVIVIDRAEKASDN